MNKEPNLFLLGFIIAVCFGTIAALGLLNFAQRQTILRLQRQTKAQPSVQVFPYPPAVPPGPRVAPVITEPPFPPPTPALPPSSPEPSDPTIPETVVLPGRITKPVAPAATWPQTKAELAATFRIKLSAAAHQPFLLAGRRADVRWWAKPQPLLLDESILRALRGIPPHEKIETHDGPLEQIGEFIAGPYQGRQAVLLHEPGMSDYFEFYARDPETGHGMLLPHYPFDFVQPEDNATVRLSNIDTAYRFPDLEYPETINLLPGMELRSIQRSFFGGPIPFPREQVHRVVESSVLGDLYYDSGFNAFIVETKTGHAVAYTIDIPFVTTAARDVGSYAVQPLGLTWWYGSSTDEYVATTLGGCGSQDARAVAYEVTPESLVQVGVTETGDPIYEYADLKTELLQKIYREWYVPFERQRAPYEEFLDNHPLFFWQDQLGRLVRFTHRDYQPAVECGKPAIYLYPPITQQVRVQVDPRGGFTHTEPPYGNGWNVVATPDGQLTDVATGTTYPYLWWDGRGGLYQAPEQYWVVPTADVEPFLRRTLGQLGLTPDETADFLEYWLPYFTPVYPYYRIGFHGTSVMNELAPLTITPAPDTVIRILMDYDGLATRALENPPRIVTPQRRGFTVVEWGGVRR